MAPKRKQVVDLAVQEQLEGLTRVLLDGDVPDWSALNQCDLGALVGLLGACDAGVMIRSSERGASRSIGIFVGGQSQWTTCRDQRELLALLEAAQATLEAIVGARQAPSPTATGKKRAARP